jgi:hydrogenase nickel incorporation protein HypA/HybF
MVGGDAADSNQRTGIVHELSIATAVLEACTAQAEGARILRIRLEIGQLAAVLPDSLRFCFELCAQGTLADGAALEILEIPGQATCDACRRTIPLAWPTGRCDCGGRLRIVAGEELRVKDMQVA